MRKYLTILLTTAVAVAAIPAVAQTKVAPVKAPTARISKTSKVVKTDGKMAGIVKGSASGTSFTLGAKGGTYMVDASKARCTYKGKFFKVSNLKGGNMVVVTGKATGQNIKATEVKITFIKEAQAAHSGKVIVPKSAVPKKAAGGH